MFKVTKLISCVNKYKYAPYKWQQVEVHGAKVEHDTSRGLLQVGDGVVLYRAPTGVLYTSYNNPIRKVNK